MKLCRHAVQATAIGAIISMMAINAVAGLTTQTFPAQGYSGSVSHEYHVYTPSSYNGSTPLPMVMVLHGCHQDHHTVINEFGWQDTAEANNFIMVAPYSNADATGTQGNPKCWRYWIPGYRVEAKGHARDLYLIAKEVEANYNVDPNKIYITGLSSGGFYTTVMAVTYNEYFAAAVAMAGGGYKETANSANTADGCYMIGEVPYFTSYRDAGSMKNDMQSEMDDRYEIPVMFMGSRYDCTVHDDALTTGTDSFVQLYGATRSNTLDCSVPQIPCENKQYSKNGKILVESYIYDGPSDFNPNGNFYSTDQRKGHYFSGAKANGSWSKTWGQDARETAWAFMNRYSRNGTVSLDSDGDGVDNPVDNCPNDRNPDQADNDADGIGNVCDATPNGEANTNTPTNGVKTVGSFGSNPGNLTMELYVPSTVQATAPVMVAMHGCSMNSGNMHGHWKIVADEKGIIVIFPGTSFGNNSAACFNWWKPGDQDRNQGEVRSIVSMVEYVKTNYNVDKSKVWVSGISAGAAAAEVLASTHPDLFAGAAIFAGIPYKCASTESRAWECMGYAGHTPYREDKQTLINHTLNAYSHHRDYPKIFLTHGSSDTTVQDYNSDSLIDKWTGVHGIDDIVDGSPALAPSSHTRVSDYDDVNGKTWIRMFRTQYMGHATPIDNTCDGGFSDTYTENKGYCAPRLAVEFFEEDQNHPPVVTLVGNPTVHIPRGGAWSDPGANATDAEDGVLSVTIGGDAVNVNVVGTYSISYTATDSQHASDTEYRTVNVQDETTNNAPVVALTGSATLHVDLNSTFSDPGAIADDSEDGVLPVAVSGSVDTAVSGSYTLTYSATDKGTQLNGQTGTPKTGTATRTVIVSEPAPSCWTSPIGDHMSAGRAATSGGFVCQTVGGGDRLPTYMYTCEYLRDFGGNPAYSIQETSMGVFNKVSSCDNPPPSDSDADGVADSSDNCPNDANADQADNDNDGIGNVCDSTPNGNQTCEDFRAYNYYHETAGRAHSSGNSFVPDYFANGSNDSMPGSTWGNNILHSADGSTWHIGACP